MQLEKDRRYIIKCIGDIAILKYLTLSCMRMLCKTKTETSSMKGDRRLAVKLPTGRVVQQQCGNKELDVLPDARRQVTQ